MCGAGWAVIDSHHTTAGVLHTLHGVNLRLMHIVLLQYQTDCSHITGKVTGVYTFYGNLVAQRLLNHTGARQGYHLNQVLSKVNIRQAMSTEGTGMLPTSKPGLGPKLG